MLAFPLVAYALYCAYRDRAKTRARRNPYSRAALLERHHRINRDYGFASMGQLYGDWIKPKSKAARCNVCWQLLPHNGRIWETDCG